jgi:hypothetical protein
MNYSIPVKTAASLSVLNLFTEHDPVDSDMLYRLYVHTS